MSISEMSELTIRDDVKMKSMKTENRKIGHRRVDGDGTVSYKKVESNQLNQAIQLGVEYSLGAVTRIDERDLLMQDFMTVNSYYFPKNGSTLTPAHNCSEFTFRAVAPLAFRYFLKLFAIPRQDFLMSLCNEPLRELSNPGASGSLFYLTSDDEFILKTVMHKEAEFLQKLLPGYYMNLNQNPHTLLPKFFGMFCYQCNQKNIRLIVMNNLLPSHVKMHMKYDLKGSTYKRKAGKREKAKEFPVYKDLDFLELLPDGLFLEQETYTALLTTMKRDCRVLESFRIMDYSLLIGIHNLDQDIKEREGNGLCEDEKKASSTKPKILHSTAMESIQAQTEPIDDEEHVPSGGIPARNHKGERLLLFLGIIDILQSYRIRKKLEHTLKSIIHDGDTVSVHRPGFYAQRFLTFMAEKVFKKVPSLDHLNQFKGNRKFRSLVSSIIALKHSPSKRNSKKESTQSQKKNMGPSLPSHESGNSSEIQELSSSLHAFNGVSNYYNGCNSTTSSYEGVSISDVRLEPRATHGTPSRISLSATSWTTPTWTEGTPSYTESSCSGDLTSGQLTRM